jgi:hypothetical protein
MDHRTRALIWLEIAERSKAFKEQAAALADDWLTLAHLEEMSRRPGGTTRRGDVQSASNDRSPTQRSLLS